MKTQKNLRTLIVGVDTLASEIRKNGITLETLVAVGFDRTGKVELSWLEFPAVIGEKREIQIEPTPGYQYLGSVQMIAKTNVIIAEAQAAALKDALFAAIVRTIAENLPAKHMNERKVFDLHLVNPYRDDQVPVKVAGQKVDPLWTKKDSGLMHLPRVTPAGLLAAKDNMILFFPFTGADYDTRSNKATVIQTFNAQIEYLNRAKNEAGFMTIVATTVRGHNFVAKIADAHAMNQAKITAQAETGARYVGTPGGDGIEAILEIQWGKDYPNLLVFPKNAKHTAALVSAS